MIKAYEEPEIQIRRYALPTKSLITTDGDVLTSELGDLENGDDYDYPTTQGQKYL